jgi:hypothetical protein
MMSGVLKWMNLRGRHAPLEHDGRELQRQDRRVEHHAPGHLEHDRVRVPEDQRVPDAPGLPQVEHQPDDDEQVSHEPGQQGRAHDRLEALDVEQVHDGGQREGARQTDAAQTSDRSRAPGN